MRTSKGLILAGLLAAATASAQKEQWLQYHTTRESHGYRHLDLKTNAPANLTLPKFKDQPYFALWTTPLDAKGRWIAFDRSRKSGPYDLVYVDTKGEGRLDDKTPAKATRVDQYYSTFDPVRVVMKGEDGPITYHLGFQFMQYDPRRVNCYAMSGGYYEGQVDLGDGKKKRLELIDRNVNGVFNDMAEDAEGCDHVTVEGDKTEQRFLGKMLEIGEDIYRIEVARDGAFVKLQKATDLTFGTVRVPEGLSEFVAFGENGHFVRKPAKGELKLPAGKYQIYQWTMTRKDSKGASWTMTGEDFPGNSRFEVAQAKPANLDIGEPVRAVVGQDNSTGTVGFDLSFKGKMNETITIRKGGQNPPGPKLTLASLDGKYRVTNTFEFG